MVTTGNVFVFHWNCPKCVSVFIFSISIYYSFIAVTPPAQKVQFILGQSQERGAEEHESHPVFSEMEELFMGEDGDMEWKETAR